MMRNIIASLACTGIASAQVVAWGQCGGKGYSGPTTCTAGYSCLVINDWFSQCQQGGPINTLPETNRACAGPGDASSTTPSTTPTQPKPNSTTLSTSVITTTLQSSATSTAPGSSSPAVDSTALPTSPSGPNNNAIQYLGRVNPSTKELTWPGTGLRFTYNGSAEIALTATGSNSAELIVDGTSSVISSVTDNIPLPAGSHTVEFRKRSEASMGSIFVQVDGTPASNKLIEFIGDSITVGYGLDGTNPCTNSAQVEDNPKTYAALAANALGADYNIVAWKGKGVVRNISPDNGPLMPELWTRWGANDADNDYTFPVQAQVVVINLGTNDFTYLNARDPIDPNVYQNGMLNFVQTVQGKYPAAKIFLMGSPMLQDASPSAADAQHTTMSNALKNVAASTGGYFVDWPTQGSDVGCDYHPNAATHAAEAPILADAIRKVMGW